MPRPRANVRAAMTRVAKACKSALGAEPPRGRDLVQGCGPNRATCAIHHHSAQMRTPASRLHSTALVVGNTVPRPPTGQEAGYGCENQVTRKLPRRCSLQEPKSVQLCQYCVQRCLQVAPGVDTRPKFGIRVRPILAVCGPSWAKHGPNIT